MFTLQKTNGMNHKIDQKLIRSTVKDAISLYETKLISEDDLKEILSLALSWEFTEHLENSLYSKITRQKKLNR